MFLEISSQGSENSKSRSSEFGELNAGAQSQRKHESLQRSSNYDRGRLAEEMSIGETKSKL